MPPTVPLSTVPFYIVRQSSLWVTAANGLGRFKGKASTSLHRVACVVTPENLIVYKLIAGRGHDYEAVGAIVNTIKTLDTAYVQGWLEQLDVADRWQRAIEEARLLAQSQPRRERMPPQRIFADLGLTPC